MVAQNLTGFAIVMVLLGFIIAVAIFHEQILVNPEIIQQGCQQSQMPGPSPVSPLEQGQGGSEPERERLDQERAKLEAERQRLDKEWVELRAEQERLDQAWEELEAERAQSAQGAEDLKAAQERLDQAWEELEAERAQVAQGGEDLKAAQKQLAQGLEEYEADRAQLEEDRGRLKSWEVNLAEWEQTVQGVWRFSLVALVMISLVVVSVGIYLAVSVWKARQPPSGAVGQTGLLR